MAQSRDAEGRWASIDASRRQAGQVRGLNDDRCPSCRNYMEDCTCASASKHWWAVEEHPDGWDGPED